MKIVLEVIPQAQQRYSTVGDWWRDSNGDLQIRSSQLTTSSMEVCVLVHELIEAILCSYRGVSQDSVDKFDAAFERSRVPGSKEEPGDDRAAPYYNEHQMATVVERLLAQQLGLSWIVYSDACDKVLDLKDDLSSNP